jgi:hypothetical protein
VHALRGAPAAKSTFEVTEMGPRSQRGPHLLDRRTPPVPLPRGQTFELQISSKPLRCQTLEVRIGAGDGDFFIAPLRRKEIDFFFTNETAQVSLGFRREAVQLSVLCIDGN